MHDSEHDDRGKDAEASTPTGRSDSESGEIMSRLPRTRPQRRNYRRPAAAESEAAAASRAAGESPAPHAAGSPRFERESEAPSEAAGIAELTVSGAYEIAKLPLKVGAHATFRALEAVARSLRSR